MQSVEMAAYFDFLQDSAARATTEAAAEADATLLTSRYRMHTRRFPR